MSGDKLYVLPLATGVLFPITFITTYTISVSEGTIKPFFSYISDTGTYPPASDVFSFLMSIGSLGMAACLYVRYKQVEEFFRGHMDPLDKMLNNIGLYLGGGVAVGTCVSGCFKEINLIAIHLFGAVFAFLGGGVYIILQSYFTFKMVPLFASRALGWIRLFLGIGVFLLALICAITGGVAFFIYTANGGTDPTRWDKKYGAYGLHVISVFTEWLLAAFLDIFILSFIPEFKKITMEQPKLIIPDKIHYNI